jgi:hypothetical protein
MIQWEADVVFIDRLEVDRGWYVVIRKEGYAPTEFVFGSENYGETNLKLGDKVKVTIEKVTRS